MHLQIDCSRFVVLKMPWRQSEVAGTRFLQENGDWIRQTLAAQPRVPRLRTYLIETPHLSLDGRIFRLRLGLGSGSARHIVDEHRRVVDLIINPRLPSEEQLIALLRDIARQYLPDRLYQWAGRIGVKVHGITIRDQRCRWGSCSETGGISLNWRLILIAPRLQDHVMLHELAHLRHFDHSKAFHRFLASLDPRSEQHGRQLDTEAARVIYLGRSQS